MLLPQTHSPEVEYNLFMAVMIMLMSERVDKCPGATLAAFPPPIFAGTTTVSLFHISLLSPLGNIEGVFI
jgi:hypothetical protein